MDDTAGERRRLEQAAEHGLGRGGGVGPHGNS
jgi:hypothetical protein